MTKADIVKEIAASTGIEKQVVLQVVEGFIIKHRAEKTARNITKNTTMVIPAHNIPAFKPAKSFVEKVK